MLSVALYARYSSDNQRDASVENQLRFYRERAERENCAAPPQHGAVVSQTNRLPILGAQRRADMS